MTIVELEEALADAKLKVGGNATILILSELEPMVVGRVLIPSIIPEKPLYKFKLVSIGFSNEAKAIGFKNIQELKE